MQKWSSPDRMKNILQEDYRFKMKRKDLNEKLKIIEIFLNENNELSNHSTQISDNTVVAGNFIRKNSNNHSDVNSSSSSKSDSVVSTNTFPNVRTSNSNVMMSNKNIEDNSKLLDQSQSIGHTNERTDVTISANTGSTSISNTNSNRVSNTKNDENQDEQHIATFCYEVSIRINICTIISIFDRLSFSIMIAL